MRRSREIETQAAKWLVRLDRDASSELRAEFEKWITSDPRHHATFLRLQRSWQRSDYLKNIRPLDGEVNENVLDTFPGAISPEVERARARRPKKSVTSTIAASVILGGLLLALCFELLHSDVQVFKTGLGGFQRIALQDGSIALLNTSSELRVHLTSKRREIKLVRGEALFTVAHDVSRPFDVTAGDTVVRAVGTAFSVRLREKKQVDIIVTEGRVAIDPPDDSLNAKLSQSSALPGLSTLSAGETVRVSAHQIHVQRIDSQDVDRELSWTKGRLSFDRITLAEAISEFNRYNRRQLVIDDSEIESLRISGSFDATDLDSFVAALETFGITAISRPSNDSQDAEVIRLVGNKNRR